MSKETNDLFESQELSDYNNWWNYMHLVFIPVVHTQDKKSVEKK